MAENKNVMPFDGNLSPLYGFDLAEGVYKVANYKWDSDSMDWVRDEGASINVESMNIDLTATNAILDDILEEVRVSYSKLVDEVSSVLLYVGEAVPGSAQDSSVWRIRKVDMSSGISILWADGNAGFDNRWDQRASKSYS